MKVTPNIDGSKEDNEVLKNPYSSFNLKKDEKQTAHASFFKIARFEQKPSEVVKLRSVLCYIPRSQQKMGQCA